MLNAELIQIAELSDLLGYSIFDLVICDVRFIGRLIDR